MKISNMEIVKFTNITQIEFKCKLSEIFTPKPSIVFVTNEVKIKKTQ